MKNRKNLIYALILPLVVVGGLVFANRGVKDETDKKPSAKSAIDREKSAREARKKWEASPDGIKYKEWEASPAGRKVHSSYAKIKKNIKAFSNMDAVVTSVTFERPNAKSSGPKWLIVKIDDEEYMMQFIPKDFEKLKRLKVGDEIVVKSRGAGYSPNHPYLIVSADYISHNNKVLYKSEPRKNKGC